LPLSPTGADEVLYKLRAHRALGALGTGLIRANEGNDRVDAW
jgi:hypothetical protein